MSEAFSKRQVLLGRASVCAAERNTDAPRRIPALRNRIPALRNVRLMSLQRAGGQAGLRARACAQACTRACAQACTRARGTCACARGARGATAGDAGQRDLVPDAR